jgi:hypothetical protein
VLPRFCRAGSEVVRAKASAYAISMSEMAVVRVGGVGLAKLAAKT